MNPDPISFDLLNFTDRIELTQIVESFCRVTGLAGGIVRMPHETMSRPIKISDLAELRITNPEVVNPSAFCSLVRGCDKGNLACNSSDLENAEKANSCGKALNYSCHMGLSDFIAPIRVCGRHVANVYLGQVRSSQTRFGRVRERYVNLLEAAGQYADGAENTLRTAFDQLPSASEKQIQAYTFFVETLANLISQRATRQAVVKMAVAAAREVGVTLNLKHGLEVYLRYAMELLNADTGTIFLLKQDDPSRLECCARQWGASTQSELLLQTQGGGIIPENARKNLEILAASNDNEESGVQSERKLFVSFFDTREEMDAYCREQEPGTRDRRGLQSLVVVPVCCGNEMFGTLDIGSKRKHAFSHDDKHVLRLFASVIGANVWMVRKRQRMVHMFGKHNAHEVMHAMVQEIPSDVNGLGCSIFVRNADGVLELTASNEFPGVSDYSKITYLLGEGFTGWVAQRGKPLRIKKGTHCRSLHLERQWLNQGVQWQGKHRNQPAQLSANYYEHRPFLGIPVKTAEGVVVGVIRIADRRDGDFTMEDERTVQVYADFLGHFLKAPRRWKGAGKDAPKVFLGHGRNTDATSSLSNYLEHMGCEVMQYEDEVEIGDYSFDVVYRLIQECDLAVILYSGDDFLRNTGEKIGRRNVAHELGLAQGILGPKRTMLLLEHDVEKPTNVDGLQHVGYPAGNVQAAFETVATYLRKSGFLPLQSGR